MYGFLTLLAAVATAAIAARALLVWQDEMLGVHSFDIRRRVLRAVHRYEAAVMEARGGDQAFRDHGLQESEKRLRQLNALIPQARYVVADELDLPLRQLHAVAAQIRGAHYRTLRGQPRAGDDDILTLYSETPGRDTFTASLVAAVEPFEAMVRSARPSFLATRKERVWAGAAAIALLATLAAPHLFWTTYYRKVYESSACSFHIEASHRAGTVRAKFWATDRGKPCPLRAMPTWSRLTFRVVLYGRDGFQVASIPMSSGYHSVATGEAALPWWEFQKVSEADFVATDARISPRDH